MSFGRIEPSFQAILKTPDDKVLEYGIASVSLTEQSIEFKSAFVPIFKMGTPLKIVRVKDQIETQSFSGEVYLSSQRMLRLVSLSDEVLPGAAAAYMYDVELNGNAAATITEEEPHKRFSLLSRTPRSVYKVFPVTIHAISLTHLKFTSDMALEPQQNLNVTVFQPFRLDKLALQVELPVNLGNNALTSYRCRILDLDGSNFANLDGFLQQLSQKTNKLFPPNAAILNEEGNL